MGTYTDVDECLLGKGECRCGTVLVQSASIFLVPIFVGVLTITPWIVTIKLAKVYNTSY